MTVGEKIKELRKKRDLTQEKLADFLCVSYQAVSKWECGLSSPDLSLIVPLARLLGVTTDELLGAAAKDTDKRREELEEMYQKAGKTGDISLERKVCEEAVMEYPGDMLLLHRLAWVLSISGVFVSPDVDVAADLERAIKLFDTVIENTRDDVLKSTAISGIVECLCRKGRKDEARKYVDLFSETYVDPFMKKQLICKCLSGEEQLRQRQRDFNELFKIFIDAVMWGQLGDRKITDVAAEAIIKALIPDGNYCMYHDSMMDIQFRKAEAAAVRGDGDAAVELLQKAMYHAKEFDMITLVNPGEYAYTAPLLDKVTVDTRGLYGEYSLPMAKGIKVMCQNDAFDLIRDREDFRALF